VSEAARPAAAADGAGAGGERRVVVAADAAALADATAAHVRRVVHDAIAARGRCHLALAGGRTPRAVYERLAIDGTPSLDWTRVHVWFGDERLVPPDHADSNYGMARAALLGRVAIPAAQVHRIAGESATTALAADAYAAALVEAFALAPGAWPVLDLVLLGVGADGHTASLFPGTSALRERARLAVGVEAPSAPRHRVSLTFPVIDAARAVVVLTGGADKAEAVARAFADEGDWDACPVRAVRPHAGTLTWHLDAAAASKLPVAPDVTIV
jgi:6-phosphogluconolactonase